MKKFLLYAGRWQLSSIVLYPCIAYIPLHPAWTTVIANAIGASIFFFVDRLIFNKGEKNE